MFGLAASGEVTGRAVSKQASWTGRASVAQFSPQDLIRRFGLPAQPTSDPKALTRATIDTRFAVDAKEARLDDLVLALDDSKLTGNFALVGLREARVPVRARGRSRRRRPLPAAESARREARRGDRGRHQAAREQHDESRRHDADRGPAARGPAVQRRRQPDPDRRRRREARGRARAPLRRHVRGQFPRARGGRQAGARARRQGERPAAAAADRGAHGPPRELQRHGRVRPRSQGHGPHDHRERADGRRQRRVRHGERRDQGLQPRTHAVRRLELQGGRAAARAASSRTQPPTRASKAAPS